MQYISTNHLFDTKLFRSWINNHQKVITIKWNEVALISRLKTSTSLSFNADENLNANYIYLMLNTCTQMPPKSIIRVTRIYNVQRVKRYKYSHELYLTSISIRVHVVNVVTIFWEEWQSTRDIKWKTSSKLTFLTHNKTSISIFLSTCIGGAYGFRTLQ